MPKKMEEIEISVVIPSLNSPMIGDTITSLLHQDFQGKYEIIVVGQDQFAQIKDNPIVRFIQTDHPLNPAKARNTGIRVTHGELIAFIDADCIAAPNWLTGFQDMFSDASVTMAGGGVTFPHDHYLAYCDNLAAFYAFLVTSPPGQRDNLPSLNLCVRKSTLLQSGLFNENKKTGEDFELTARLKQQGETLFFNPAIQVAHISSRRTFTAMMDRFFKFGHNSIKVDRKFQDAGTPFFFKNWLILCVATPFLAGGVTMKIILQNRTDLLAWLAAPMIYLAKLSWCFGAVQSLRCNSSA